MHACGFWKAWQTSPCQARGAVAVDQGTVPGWARVAILQGQLVACLHAVQDQSHAIGLAVGQINGGQHEEALVLLDEIISNARAPNFSAHLVRGTGRALKRDLPGLCARSCLMPAVLRACFASENTPSIGGHT